MCCSFDRDQNSATRQEARFGTLDATTRELPFEESSGERQEFMKQPAAAQRPLSW
jgi:hypothetical protein